MSPSWVISCLRLGVPAFVILLHVDRLDPLCQFDDRRLGGAGFGEPLQESLEMQAVDEHDVGTRHCGGIGGLGLINMGVAVGADQSGQLDTVAADISGEVADDRETGDDLERLGGGCVAANGSNVITLESVARRIELQHGGSCQNQAVR